MNYEITGSCVSELSSNKLNKKLYILLILSIVFIPAAYVLIAAVFIDKIIKKNVKIKINNSLYILAKKFRIS